MTTRFYKSSKLWATLAGLALVLGPMYFALLLAERQSIREQEVRAALLAKEVLRRSHGVSQQIEVAYQKLEARAHPDPCSEGSLHLMRQIALESNYLAAVGFVNDDRLVCSSLGLHGVGLSIGSANFLSRTGFYVRAHVKLPGASEQHFLMSTRLISGYSAIVQPDVPIDVLTNDIDVGLGLYSLLSNQPLLKRGPFLPAWHKQLGDKSEVQFFDGQQIVAIAKSGLYDYASYATIPESHVAQSWRNSMLWLAPLGIVAGAILAVVLHQTSQHYRSLPALLKSALRRGELFLVYQPVVALDGRHWVGAEALLRWRRKNGEWIAPDLFIPMAERVGLIQRITTHVIALFFRDLTGVLRAFPKFHVSVNFSAADFQDHHLADLIKSKVEHAGLSMANFHVEATERALVNDVSIKRTLVAMRNQGTAVAIDDFGTGYSSLSYLTQLEVDFLKIDKSFVDTIGADAATSQVVNHIIEMAKSLNLQMIAEGVETEEQAEYLRVRGVQYAQGWLFSKPLVLEDLKAGLMNGAAG